MKKSCFISYSYDTKKHESWVLRLASKIKRNGIKVIIDKFDPTFANIQSYTYNLFQIN